MKILALGMLIFGLSSANASDTNPESGIIRAYGSSYCTANDDRYECQDRACADAEQNAEAEAEYACSSFGGVNATNFRNDTYTFEENTSTGICEYVIRYVCIH